MVGFKDSYAIPMRKRFYPSSGKWRRFIHNWPDQCVYDVNPNAITLFPGIIRRRMIQKIHSEINKLPYKEDIQDIWEIKRGRQPRDCDDKTLEMRQRLNTEAGILLEHLRPHLCTVNIRGKPIGHMVLAVITEDGDFICDPTMLSISMIPYRMLNYNWYSRYHSEKRGWQRPTFYKKRAPQYLTSGAEHFRAS